MASARKSKAIEASTDDDQVVSVPSVEAAPSRPGLDALVAAKLVEVATVSPTSCPILVGGVIVTPEPRTYEVTAILSQGDCYLRAIAEDEQINVRIVEE